MLAYEGAIIVPLVVPLICKKCSPLNVMLLYFSTNVSNWTRHSVGGSFYGSLVPGLSTCFDTVIVYNDVTPIEKRMVPEGRFEDNQWCLSNVRVALIHEVEGGHR